jgi:hypothetical protein
MATGVAAVMEQATGLASAEPVVLLLSGGVLIALAGAVRRLSF